MTAKQQLFVDEYLIDLNATQAALRAGYSEKTARSIGAENLSKPDIEKAIADALGADRSADPNRGRGVVRLGSGTRFFRKNWFEELKQRMGN